MVSFGVQFHSSYLSKNFGVIWYVVMEGVRITRQYECLDVMKD